jgi:hypothetical protein
LICLVAIPLFLENDRCHAFRAAICIVVQIDLTQRADGSLEKLLYGRNVVRTRPNLHKGSSSDLHLGFIHVNREVGYDNFFNRLRGGTSCFDGTCYPSLGRRGCARGSKDLSTCIVTATGSTPYLLGSAGNGNNLHKEEKKVRRGLVTTKGIKCTSSRDLSIVMGVKVLFVKKRGT